MPKVKTSKKRKAQNNEVAGLAPTMPRDGVAGTRPAMSGSRQEKSSPLTPVTTLSRPGSPFGGSGTQGLVMPALVALGCWGMAISFAFFSADPNHYLFAGMAALMGLMWSFSLGLRIRRDRLIASANDMQLRRRTRSSGPDSATLKQ